MRPHHYLVIAFVGIVASILAPLVSRYINLRENEAFSVSNKVPYTLNPKAHLFRNRMGSWKSPADRSLIQWWNYAIVDAETGMSWTIAFGLSESKKPAAGNLKKAQGDSERPLVVSSAFIAQRLGATMISETSDFGILNSTTTVTNSCDLTFYHPKTRAVLHTQVVSEDGDHYKVTAQLEGVSFDLTFHRVHGVYFGEDDDPNSVATCSPTSTFYGYHSTVEGTITTEKDKYTFDTSPRYRAYAGSTWGCYLPFGNPPVDYPWTWVWLVIPRDNDPQNDIALTVGTVRYQEHPLAPGLLKGFFGDVLVLDIGDEHHHLSSLRLLHNTSFDFRLISAAAQADEYYVSSSLKVSDWYTLTDRFGSSRLPLVQEYEYISHTMKVTLKVTAKPGEHFRIAMSRDGNMYSDFRANGIDVYATISRLSPSGAVTETVFDGLASSRFSAVEYAYADPYPTSAEQLAELSQNALKRLTSSDFDGIN